MRHKFQRGPIAKTAMGTFFVALFQSSSSGARPGLELLNVQQFVAKSAEERFGKAVSPKRIRLDVEPLQARSPCPSALVHKRLTLIESGLARLLRAVLRKAGSARADSTGRIRPGFDR